jgi:GNAT superfamily N-acetyltransferase
MKPSAIRVAARCASTTPLPKLTRDEPGLMTLDEYLTHRNPGGKFHSSETYDWSLAQMNRDYLPERHLGGFSEISVSDTGGGYVFRKDGEPVGILPTQGSGKGTLFYDWPGLPRRMPVGFSTLRNESVDLPVEREKRVKYLSDVMSLVQPRVEPTGAKPVILQRIKLKGEPFTVKALGQPGLNKGVTLIITNAEGKTVAQASDEWGATLLVVAKEYRGMGLGKVLGTFWYDQNPSYQSGGFTPQGEQAAVKRWAARVRQFLSNGWYTELLLRGAPNLTIRPGELRKRIKAILADLPERSQVESVLPPDETPTQRKPQTLVYVDYPTFVVYDAQFLDDPEAEDADEHIHGYGFFRDSPHVGSFLFTLDYDRPYREMVNAVALQMARDEGEPIYVGEGYGDMLEPQGLPVEQEGDYLTLARDLVPLDALGAKERRIRRQVDPYGKKEVLLMERAESKRWA